MGTHPCGHVIARAWLHECGMEGDSIRRVLAYLCIRCEKIMHVGAPCVRPSVFRRGIWLLGGDRNQEISTP